MVRQTILLAVSDAAGRASLAAGLREAQYDVTEAESGEKLLRAAAGARPGVVVLEWCLFAMPAVQQALVGDDPFPLIVLGSREESGHAREAAVKGSQAFLLAPVDTPQLLASVDVAVARAEQLCSLRATCSQLESALQQGRETSIAIGILMARQQLGERAAFDLLRSYARRNRRRLADVSADLARGVGAVNELCAGILATPDD